MRRKTLCLLFSALTVTGVLIFGHYAWSVAAHREVLASEQNHSLETLGLHILWRVGKNTNIQETPSYFQIVLGARPMGVYLNNRLDPPVPRERLAKVANALKFFGSVTDIGIQDAGEEGTLFLLEVGDQPSLASLHCFRSLIDDRVSVALKRFPSINQISLGETNFTGIGFPNLPKLESIDLTGSPIAAEGLTAICRSPALTRITLASDTRAQHETLINEIRLQKPNMTGRF